MNYSEAVSKRVLEAILPGSTLEYRLTQSHGEYDFELHYRDGSSAAVEVTAAVDESLMKSVGAIRGKRAGGSILRSAACRKSWVIFPAKGASIPKIRTDADQCLAKLEQEGIDSFFCVSNSRSVREICRHLQVTGGGAFSWEGEPTIQIAFPIGGGAVGPSLAVRTGESEAWKLDNRKKLGFAKTAERHLVVYIDAGNGSVWTALTSFAPPSILPKLPDEITNLWLVGHSGTDDYFVVWRASTNEAWHATMAVCAPPYAPAPK